MQVEGQLEFSQTSPCVSVLDIFVRINRFFKLMKMVVQYYYYYYYYCTP